MLFLKFTAFIIVTSLFHSICLGSLYRHKRLWNLILVKIITNEV
jgi:hypothetical protein